MPDITHQIELTLFPRFKTEGQSDPCSSQKSKGFDQQQPFVGKWIWKVAPCSRFCTSFAVCPPDLALDARCWKFWGFHRARDSAQELSSTCSLCCPPRQGSPRWGRGWASDSSRDSSLSTPDLRTGSTALAERKRLLLWTETRPAGRRWLFCRGPQSLRPASFKWIRWNGWWRTQGCYGCSLAA